MSELDVAASYTKRDQMLAAAPQTSPTPMRLKSPRACSRTRTGFSHCSTVSRSTSSKVTWSKPRSSIKRLRAAASSRAVWKIPYKPQNGSAAANTYSTTISPITMTGGYRPRRLAIGSVDR